MYSVVSMQVLLSVLGVCVASFLYSLTSFVTSDRLSSKSRRVILPAHLSLFGFYLCIVVSRIAALTLFAHAFGYFVLLFVVVHWILSVFGVLNQKSQFCLDYAVRPRKERWWLEVPFAFYAACLYQFVFFSLKEGKTRYALSVYLVVTLIENVLMVVLFFTEYSSLWYAPASIAMVIGLFLLGALLLLVYYVVLHPDKTEDWYWIGVPKRCCEIIGRGKSKSYRPHNVEISSPTLVNMNGQATNAVSQTRISGLQPITSILSRNKTTGQIQLSAPPPVIDSGIPSSRDEDYYKKPRVYAPPQQQRLSSSHLSSNEQLQSETASSRHHSRSGSPHYQVPSGRPAPASLGDNHSLATSGIPAPSLSSAGGGYDPQNPTLPLRHNLCSGSTHYPPGTSSNQYQQPPQHDTIRMLQIPGVPSLGSSVRTDSDTCGSGVPESDPTTLESYIPTPSGLHVDMGLESAFHATLNMDTLAVSNPGILNNANSSNANHSRNHHDIDIDSPVVSPYDTLETARKEIVELHDAEAILEENEIAGGVGGEEEEEEDGGRFSASPPNLPTPDFTEHALLPGNPLPPSLDHHHQHYHQQQQNQHVQFRDDGVNDIHQELHEMQHEAQRGVPVPPPLPPNPHQKFPLPPSSSHNIPGAQNSAPQGLPSQSLSSSGQLQMFVGIPAKRDYNAQQPSQLEIHYFPEPSSHSTPNLPRGPIIGGAGGQGGGSGSSLRGPDFPPSDGTAPQQGPNQVGKTPAIGVPNPHQVR